MMAFNRKKLKEAIRDSVCRVYSAQISSLDIYRNTLDCFSAVIDSISQDMSLDDWMIQEKQRQIQKTKQNAVGLLHEEIIGSIDGVKRVPVGNLVDIVCHEKKLIAEIKNKHNTTKGNHKVSIYRDLAKVLESHPGYTGYYVEILPKSCASYNESFTPSDNQLKACLPARSDIRRIDGKTFYHILTGYENALEELYLNLPGLVSEIIKEEFGVSICTKSVIGSKYFVANFKKAYG